jgi:hypothetical protein
MKYDYPELRYCQEEFMDLSERLRKIVETMTPSTRRFAALEEATKISAKTWQTWWSRGGKASADMIQAAGQVWPHFAFWLVTGIDDYQHGHTTPGLTEAEERGNRRSPERTVARDYFLKVIEYEKWRAEHPRGSIQHGDLNHAAQLDHWEDLHRLIDLRNYEEKRIDETGKGAS